MLQPDLYSFEVEQAMSTVTAIIPKASSTRVMEAVTQDPNSSAFLWDARGTLLREQWYSRFMPSISPAKTMFQLLLPDHEVDRMVGLIVEEGRLHQQAAGAVFSTPCDDIHIGKEFHKWPIDKHRRSEDASHDLRENLDVIYCITEPDKTDSIARAAIKAGAHGPVVFFGEGRGLRDRLGWLRITKQARKEVITVIADSSDADEIFAVMAKAGQLHLPGRGFMYRMPVDKGMFNLPSRIAHHHYEANMQQIINAIDHLNGHSHWRDQAVFSVGGEGKGAGLSFLAQQAAANTDKQVCVSMIAQEAVSDTAISMLLESGAPGVNVSQVRFAAADIQNAVAGGRLKIEYALLRCVVPESTANSMTNAVVDAATAVGMLDTCIFTQPVADVATYVPGVRDYRVAS